MPLVEVIEQERVLLAKLRAGSYWLAKAHEAVVDLGDDEAASCLSRKFFKMESMIDQQEALIDDLERRRLEELEGVAV